MFSTIIGLVVKLLEMIFQVNDASQRKAITDVEDANAKLRSQIRDGEVALVNEKLQVPKSEEITAVIKKEELNGDITIDPAEGFRKRTTSNVPKHRS